MVQASVETSSGGYEYGHFGELLRATGPMAKINSFRFSTKFQDDETDLVHYGFRNYNPNLGRWVSRDPLLESAFMEFGAFNAPDKHFEPDLNENGFVGNLPTFSIDYLGAGILCECRTFAAVPGSPVGIYPTIPILPPV